MSTPVTPDNPERDAIRKRIKARRDFWQMLVVFGVIAVGLILVWYFSGAGYFWPVWPLFGFAIAAIFSGLNAFGVLNRDVTESDIDAELQRRNNPPA